MTYKAFCGVVHEAQLEALLVKERLCKGSPQGVWRKGCLMAELKLGKEFLEQNIELVKERPIAANLINTSKNFKFCKTMNTFGNS